MAEAVLRMGEDAPSIASRRARGERARRAVPHEAHAELPVRPAGVDPVALLERQAADDIPGLVPVRYGRMLVSPFTFYRGAAVIMSDDLGSVPNTGLHAQLCGDAHVGNFGLFASFERRLVFDVNDFDETYPGPFEWDLKRLAASIEAAGRDNGFDPSVCRRAVVAMSKSYRKAMRGFTGMGEIDLWYARLDVVASLAELRRVLDEAAMRRVDRAVRKSLSRDRWHAARKTTEVVDGHLRFRLDPPLLVPLDQVYPGGDATRRRATLLAMMADYAQTLGPAVRHMLQQYTLTDVARKVVGVGSVGRRAWVFLLEGTGGMDPLVLQSKEARASVLEHGLALATDRGVTVGAADEAGIDMVPGHASQGQRVVTGQRIMLATGDLLLGWKRARINDTVRDYYVRQLRDWKGQFAIEDFAPDSLEVYGRYCAWILARSHARSGDRFAIDAYLRKGRGFDEALADFAARYADRNEQDHAALEQAARGGRVAIARDV
ncbi:MULTISPECIES: DUF2252 domain-containing protein [Citricoccus]|uniref:DUF2252 domain-containing protein n=1 Tax=Citricoccus TaxID=169133 RepID=UPI000255EE7B|nr:DUF2252 domain-containing protein [Citricoccus sp. CH26A]